MSDLIDGRENWGSRPGFILAAIGSAVGLGNVWRFPYECYSHGGSAFLIPYIVAMVVIGIPLLIMEFSLGHLTQQAAPNAFRRVGRKWEFVGWWPIVLSFVIVTYYAVVLAWCLNYLVDSFDAVLPWAASGAADASKTYFYDEYLQFTGDFHLGGIRWPIVVSLAVIWTLMYLCIFKGVRLVGKIVLWTVPIPWMMLIILMIRGLTMEGAIQGLEYYLEPNWEVLKDAHVWRAAFGQVFFSMTIGFGVMVTYASFLHRKSDLNNNALIIGLADLGTSFVAGIAVFAVMGAMAHATGQPVDEVLDQSKSLGLAFVAFPKALAALPSLANAFSIIFFIALLLLGIDSAFSITEANLASLLDKTGWKRTRVLGVLSVVGFSIGLVFTTRGGLMWFDAVDHFVNNGTLGIIFVGLVECIVLGWMFDLKRLRAHANRNSDWQVGVWWEWSIKLFIPMILAGLVIWSTVVDFRGPSMKLTPDDILEPQGLARKLTERDGPVAEYVAAAGFELPEGISEAQIGDPCATFAEEDKKGLGMALATSLNGVLHDPCFYQAERFAGVLITPDTKALIKPKLQGRGLMRLNRLLLQEAFAGEIEPSGNVGGFIVDAQGRLIGRNVFGVGMTIMVFLVAVILALWRPKETSKVVEFDN